jgi:hypothetical protein
MIGLYIATTIGLIYGLIQIAQIRLVIPEIYQLLFYAALTIVSITPWMIQLFCFFSNPQSRVGIILESIISALLADKTDDFLFYLWDHGLSINCNYPNERGFINHGSAVFCRQASEVENGNLSMIDALVLNNHNCTVHLFNETDKEAFATANARDLGLMISEHKPYRCHYVTDMPGYQATLDFYPDLNKLSWGFRGGKFRSPKFSRLRGCNVDEFLNALTILCNLTVTGYIKYSSFRLRRGQNICHAYNIIELWLMYNSGEVTFSRQKFVRQNGVFVEDTNLFDFRSNTNCIIKKGIEDVMGKKSLELVFGIRAAKHIYEYIGMYYHDLSVRLIEYLCSNKRVRKVKGDLLTNWQAKRFNKDISYILIYFGKPPLKNTTKISPTSRVRKFVGELSKYEESANYNYDIEAQSTVREVKEKKEDVKKKPMKGEDPVSIVKFRVSEHLDSYEDALRKESALLRVKFVKKCSSADDVRMMSSLNKSLKYITSKRKSNELMKLFKETDDFEYLIKSDEIEMIEPEPIWDIVQKYKLDEEAMEKDFKSKSVVPNNIKLILKDLKKHSNYGKKIYSCKPKLDSRFNFGTHKKEYKELLEKEIMCCQEYLKHCKNPDGRDESLKNAISAMDDLKKGEYNSENIVVHLANLSCVEKERIDLEIKNAQIEKSKKVLIKYTKACLITSVPDIELTERYQAIKDCEDEPLSESVQILVSEMNKIPSNIWCKKKVNKSIKVASVRLIKNISKEMESICEPGVQYVNSKLPKAALIERKQSRIHRNIRYEKLVKTDVYKKTNKIKGYRTGSRYPVLNPKHRKIMKDYVGKPAFAFIYDNGFLFNCYVKRNNDCLQNDTRRDSFRIVTRESKRAKLN